MYRSCVLAVAILASCCARRTPEQTLIYDAATALGGADRIRSLTTLVVTGSGSAPNAGQNRIDRKSTRLNSSH